MRSRDQNQLGISKSDVLLAMFVLGLTECRKCKRIDNGRRLQVARKLQSFVSVMQNGRSYFCRVPK